MTNLVLVDIQSVRAPWPIYVYLRTRRLLKPGSSSLRLTNPLAAYITMLFSFLRASLVAVVASAIAVSADSSLAVRTSTPNVNVDGLENLKVTATVINTGNETLKLLNDPRSVLNPFPGNSFNITDSSGSHPSFNGALVNCASVRQITRMLMLPASASRPSTAPRMPQALMIPAFSPFSTLALPSMSLMTVS